MAQPIERLGRARVAGGDQHGVPQAQHVRAYAGCPITGELIVDPRYVWVIGKHTLTEWSQLGGKWAPSTTYGTEIEQLMQKLIA